MSPRKKAEAARVVAWAAALPEAERVVVAAWDDEVTWRVNNKVFLFGGAENTWVGLKVGQELMAALIAAEPRVTQMPYIGRHGWISVDLEGADEAFLDEVEEWLWLSYKLVAPKRLGRLLVD